MKIELHQYLSLQKWDIIWLVYQWAVWFKTLLITHNFEFKEDWILVKDYEKYEDKTRFFSYKRNIAVFINNICFWEKNLIDHFNKRVSNNGIYYKSDKWNNVFSSFIDLKEFILNNQNNYEKNN